MSWTWKLPWLTEKFESPLPAVELVARMQQATARPAHRRDIYPELPAEFFRGEVFANGFIVTRAISRPNAAEPAIYGSVAGFPTRRGCGVCIHFRLKRLWLWLIWAIVSMFWFLKASGAFGSPASGVVMIPFITLVFSVLLLPIGFGSEVIKSRAYLINLLELKAVGRAELTF
jgi:hypothetical protein